MAGSLGRMDSLILRYLDIFIQHNKARSIITVTLTLIWDHGCQTADPSLKC